MVFHHPLGDLLFERIKLGGTRRTWFRNDRLWVLQIFAHRRTRDVQLLRNFLHRFPLCVEIVYRIHCLTPKHGCSPEVLILISFSLQPSWGSVNSPPARVYTGFNRVVLSSFKDFFSSSPLAWF